ncbi:MAG: hypothetical protein AMXMBFR22_33050 [Phycisphaerae bacterium]
MLPDHWLRFASENHLFGVEVELPEDADISGVGAVIEILTDEGATEEARELYPGIRVAQDGFIPVGGCGIGTGDPYFINVHDGANGPLYRISHEAVHADGYDRAEAVAVVLARYTDLLRFLPNSGRAPAETL